MAANVTFEAAERPPVTASVHSRAVRADSRVRRPAAVSRRRGRPGGGDGELVRGAQHVAGDPAEPAAGVRRQPDHHRRGQRDGQRALPRAARHRRDTGHGQGRPPQRRRPTAAASPRPSRPARPAGRRRPRGGRTRRTRRGRSPRPGPMPRPRRPDPRASAVSAAACTPSTTTSVTTANAPTPPSRITASARSGRSVAAQAVGGVGQPVDVHAAGGERQEADGEQPGGRHPERRQADQHRARDRTQQGSDDRRPAQRTRRGAPDVRSGDPHRQHREPAQRQEQPAQQAHTPTRASGTIPLSAAGGRLREQPRGHRPAAGRRRPRRTRRPGGICRSSSGVSSRCSAASAQRRLGGALGEQPPVACTGGQLVGHQRGGDRRRGRRAAPGSGAPRPGRRNPASTGEVGPARDAQQGERVAGVRPGAAQGVADRRGLAHPRLVVDPAPAADDGHRLRTRDRGDQHRGRGRGADPDRAGHEQVRPGVDLVVHECPPDVDGALGLVVGQRVRPVDPARAGADAVAGVRRQRAVRSGGVGGVVDGHVDDPQRHPGAEREHRDGRGVLARADHPARRDVRRVGGDARGGDAVVGGHEHHPRPGGGPRRARALHGREPTTQLGEPAQRAGGHRELVVPGDRGAAGLRVGRGDRVHGPILARAVADAPSGHGSRPRSSESGFRKAQPCRRRFRSGGCFRAATSAAGAARPPAAAPRRTPRASAALSAPSSSRNTRPARVDGTTPSPTSADTSTTRPRHDADGVDERGDAVADDGGHLGPLPGLRVVEHAGQPGGEVVDEQRGAGLGGAQERRHVRFLHRRPTGGPPGAVRRDPRVPFGVTGPSPRGRQVAHGRVRGKQALGVRGLPRPRPAQDEGRATGSPRAGPAASASAAAAAASPG